jgi:hypothetical protein
MPSLNAVLLAAATAVCAALVALAFVLAPSSCEGGLGLYALAGLVGVPLLFGMPFAVPRRESAMHPATIGTAFVACGAAAWTLGFFASGMRILCRLF